MRGSTCIPRKVYQVLDPLKRPCRYAQGQHLLVFGWLLMALMRDPGQGTCKGLTPYLPPTLTYGPTVRMLRSAQWDAEAVLCQMATATLRSLSPPSDGILYLVGDSTVQEKRGRKHPWGHTTRHRERAPYPFGVEMVLLIASWGHLRVPLVLALIDPQSKGHQHLLCRQMLQDVAPPAPAWVRQRVVGADAGFAANAPLRLITEKHYPDVFAMPRTRQLTPGKHLRDLGPHLPKRCSHRRARHKPAGRRRASWVFTRRATLPPLGDVTIVVAQKRRHDGPKGVKILVTNLPEASAGTILRGCLKSSGCCEPTQYQTRHGEVNHGLTVLRQPFIVLAQAA